MGQLASLKTLNLYIVGEQKGFLLAELGRLNLKGKLHIKNMERVTSEKDANEANLAGKNLNHLLLSWERNEVSQLQENVEQILEVLHPHTQLKTLSVQGYRGSHFPQWISNPTLKDLYLLELKDCENCTHLPPLEKLPSLQNLKLCNMNHVEFVDGEFCDGGAARGFKALKVLILEKLPNLMKLSKKDSKNMFPCLTILQIADCPKLSSPCPPSVNELILLRECNQTFLGSIQNLHSLQSLCFIDNKQLTSFPDGVLRGLSRLKKLHIYGQEKLEVLPIEIMHLNALEELHIARCSIYT